MTYVVDLGRAKNMVDLLGMLEQKTQGNLSRDEAEFLKRLLVDLRMRFVQAKSGGTSGVTTVVGSSRRSFTDGAPISTAVPPGFAGPTPHPDTTATTTAAATNLTMTASV